MNAGIIWQHLRAPNDPSSNPQRLIIVYRLTDGDAIKVLDEGYRGRSCALRDGGIPSGTVELPSIDITRATYHAMLRRARIDGTAE